MLVYIRPRHANRALENVRKNMTRATQSKESKWSWFNPSARKEPMNGPAGDTNRPFGDSPAGPSAQDKINNSAIQKQQTSTSTQARTNNSSSTHNQDTGQEEEKQEE